MISYILLGYIGNIYFPVKLITKFLEYPKQKNPNISITLAGHAQSSLKNLISFLRWGDSFDNTGLFKSTKKPRYTRRIITMGSRYMFHRSTAGLDKAATDSQPQAEQQKVENKQYQSRVASSAVERYAKKPQTEVIAPNNLANQNAVHSMYATEETTNTYNHVTLNEKKEINSMNNPEPQSKDNSQTADKAPVAQNRDVNIPGNNFQRPGAAPAVAGRPNYPGSYAANTSANNPYAAQSNNSMSNGRKLVIGQGITLSGEIEACEHLIVEGTIEATLKGASVLDVSESGAFLGTVEIDEANIAGRFEGDITVKGRLTIAATGEVVGSIAYKELSMEAGAVIDGSVSPIGSTNTSSMINVNKKSSAPKAKKAPMNNGAELPFSDKAEAAE